MCPNLIFNVNYRSRVRRWLLVTYTKWFIKLMWRTEPKEPKSLELLGEPVEVFPAESNNPYFAQVTPAGTIVWNQKKLDELSEVTQRCVLRHELSHKQRHSFFKGLLYGTSLWFAAGLVILTFGLTLLLGGQPVVTVAPIFFVGCVLMGVFVAAVRLDETLAEYDALQYLGEDEFVKAHQEISETSNTGMIVRAWTRLAYPRVDQTIALYRIINRARSK